MKIFSVTDFGAVADGRVCTDAVQRAIDACHAEGGGRVEVSGGRFVIGTVRLYSNMELYLATGAALVASPDPCDFPDVDYGFFPVRMCPRGNARCMIFIGECENTVICGPGEIDGNAAAYLTEEVLENGQRVFRRNGDVTCCSDAPGRLIFAMSSRKLSFSDFTVTEMPGGWAMWINDCERASVSRLSICCNPHYPNADGVHINASVDVTVSDCVLHTGDDSIIIRDNCNALPTPRICERITVKGCVLSSRCQAVRIGWRGDREIRDCVLSDLVITDSGRGIVIELPNHASPYDIGTQPTHIHRICFQSIVIDGCRDRPVFVMVYPDNPYGGIHDIYFSGMTASAARFPTVIGRPDAQLENIGFSNCRFTVDQPDARAQKAFSNVKNLTLDGVSFDISGVGNGLD